MPNCTNDQLTKNVGFLENIFQHQWPSEILTDEATA